MPALPTPSAVYTHTTYSYKIYESGTTVLGQSAPIVSPTTLSVLVHSVKVRVFCVTLHLLEVV